MSIAVKWNYQGDIAVVGKQDLENMLFTTCDCNSSLFLEGKPLSPGAGSGRLLRTREEVATLLPDETGIYCCKSLSPEDLSLMSNSQITGYLIESTDDTRHEVVILRASGKAVVGGINPQCIASLDNLTINGGNGFVYQGLTSIKEPPFDRRYIEGILNGISSKSPITVRANADTPAQARTARLFGAKGLGPVRTEYMFYTEGRLPLMQRFILTSDDTCLATLAELQKKDFEAILKEMNRYPVGIRLFDPPFNEFTPKTEKDKQALATYLGIEYSALCESIQKLEEDNPMLGTRGVRLGILRPEVYKMQLVAAFSAAASLVKKGYTPMPDITVPFIAFPKEIELIRRTISDVASDTFRKEGASCPYTVTAMIELPIACLRAGDIAPYVEGFSFGTNDLAQTTYGLSRTDMGRSLEMYKEKGIIRQSPFATLDAGLIELLAVAIERGKKTNYRLRVGICGEQAAYSVKECLDLGMDYISCSPYRVPFVSLESALIQQSIEFAKRDAMWKRKKNREMEEMGWFFK